MIRTNPDNQGNHPLHPSRSAPVRARRLCCDDWEQASHSGDIVHAVEAGALGEEDVVELGAVLAGVAPGRRDEAAITAFDSTGLAIQDLAIALAALERYRSDPSALEGVGMIELG